MDTLIAYRNTNTDETFVRTAPDSALEARPNFERIPLSQADPLARDEAQAAAKAKTTPPSAPAESGMVAYRNDNLPDELHVFSGANADLDVRPNFRRVSLAEVPEATKEAVLRAAAEADMREVAAAGQGKTGGTPGPVTPRATHYDPVGTNDGTGVLHREDMRDLAAPSAYDLALRERVERAHPPTEGVLTRPDLATPELFESVDPADTEPVEPAEDDDGEPADPAQPTGADTSPVAKATKATKATKAAAK